MSTATVVVLEESPCPRRSSITNLKGLVLFTGSQVLVLVLEPQVLVLVIGSYVLVLVLEPQVLVLVIGSQVIVLVLEPQVLVLVIGSQVIVLVLVLVLEPQVLVLVLVLILEPQVLVLVLEPQVLVLVIGSQVLVLVLVLEPQVLDNNTEYVAVSKRLQVQRHPGRHTVRRSVSSEKPLTRPCGVVGDRLMLLFRVIRGTPGIEDRDPQVTSGIEDRDPPAYVRVACNFAACSFKLPSQCFPSLNDFTPWSVTTSHS